MKQQYEKAFAPEMFLCFHYALLPRCQEYRGYHFQILIVFIRKKIMETSLCNYPINLEANFDILWHQL